MKMFSKTLCLVIATIMGMAMIVAGCGNSQGTAASTEKVSISSEAAANSGEAKTLKILAPLGENPEILFADREQYPVWQEFQKILDANGIKLEFETVPTAEQYKVVVQTRLASASDLPDIVNISPVDNTTALNLGKQGIIIPINSIFKEDSEIKNFWEKNAPMAPKLTTAPDGNIYWFSNLQIISYQGKINNGSTCMALNIRLDWLDKLGLQPPKTAGEFANVMKQFREKDVNGSGTADEILVLDPGSFDNGIAQWFGLSTALSGVNINEGKVYSPWYQPGIKDYLKYISQLVKDGIIDTSLIGENTIDQQNQKMAENKIGATHSYCMQKWLEPQVKAGGAQFMPIAQLIGVEGIKPSLSIEPYYYVWGKWAITKNCKNLDTAGALLDVLYTDKYADLCTYGIEGLSYDVKDGVKTLREGIDNSHWKEMAANKTSPGDRLWGDSILPRLRFAPFEDELNTAPDYKTNQQKEFLKDYSNIYPNNNDMYLVLPDDQTLEEKTKIMTDLTTYSKELATKFALSQASFDDWDKYMQDLKNLGLDKLLEMDQQLLDRFNSIK